MQECLLHASPLGLCDIGRGQSAQQRQQLSIGILCPQFAVGCLQAWRLWAGTNKCRHVCTGVFEVPNCERQRGSTGAHVPPGAVLLLVRPLATLARLAPPLYPIYILTGRRRADCPKQVTCGPGVDDPGDGAQEALAQKAPQQHWQSGEGRGACAAGELASMHHCELVRIWGCQRLWGGPKCGVPPCEPRIIGEGE